MSGANWLQLVPLVVAVLVTAPLLGAYVARVLGTGAAPGDRVFAPVERGIYRLTPSWSSSTSDFRGSTASRSYEACAAGRPCG